MKVVQVRRPPHICTYKLSTIWLHPHISDAAIASICYHILYFILTHVLHITYECRYTYICVDRKTYTGGDCACLLFSYARDRAKTTCSFWQNYLRSSVWLAAAIQHRMYVWGWVGLQFFFLVLLTCLYKHLRSRIGITNKCIYVQQTE